MLNTVILFLVLISALVLWFVIFAKGYWYLKLVAITITLVFSILLTTSLHKLSGWPTEQQLPEKFEFFWALMSKPVEGKTDGAIYIWARDLNPKDYEWYHLFKPNQDQPRAYKLDYSQTLVRQGQQARDMIKQGKRVIGERSNLTGKRGNKKGNGKKGRSGKKGIGKRGMHKKGNEGQAWRGHNKEFIFYEFNIDNPPLPPKDLDKEN